MEEELNEHDLEERLYAMLHHVDETQNNLIDSHQNKFDVIQFAENGPRSTLRRYWRTGPDSNPYQKSNVPKNLSLATAAKTIKDPAVPTDAKTTKDSTVTKTAPAPDDATPKQERSPPKPPSPVDLSIFQSPVPQNVKKTIEFLDHEENKPVVLESSDEDEVVEVALPPKPTITIESSDEDELHIVNKISPLKADPKSIPGYRAVSASPVPSVVSSVSDEFIRGDCIALNISSRHPDKHSFDFSLHGSDLLGQGNASSKKKKKKKNKEAVTSTPIVLPANEAEACFATPKSKAKNKKQKSKLFTETSLLNPDMYDSDSNLSTADTNKNRSPYIVTKKSLPSADVYESDSNQSEIVKETNTDQSNDKFVIEAYSSDSSASDGKPVQAPIVSKKNISQHAISESVDLTENDNYVTIDDTGICDSIVIGNVTGFAESMDYGDEDTTPKGDISKYVSSKVPSILNDNLDFDNLKGIEKICKKRRYSLTTLRAEMDKFYNESWGGEDFNHKEIQKNMSRDKSLWAIDPKDRMQSLAQRKVRCNYCNRVGHRDDTCRQKPPVCYMCGSTGHFEPRCPTKICVNCGAPNFMYSTMCRNCSSWPRVKCAECGQAGHPASHCPDLWRRYHNTVSIDTSLEMCNQTKKSQQQYCSGCARRGHLVHSCRVSLPFSGLPVNSPYVNLYWPVYPPAYQPPPTKPARSKSFSENTQHPNKNKTKRLSKSPTVHETHVNKKRNSTDNTEMIDENPAPAQKNTKEVDNTPKRNKNLNKSIDSVKTVEKAPDFIPVNSSNHDNKGRVIQDNEVSDTSDVITSSRIYVTNEIINKFTTKEGQDWLKATAEKLDVTVGPADVNSFLSITGKLADQEVFQAELRQWVQTNTNRPKKSSTPDVATENSDNTLLPKNRNNLLRHLDNSLKSLEENLGDPQALFKELTYSKKKHNKLMKQKIISPQKLSNSRLNLNQMFKRLNTILLGQAGLADGSEHLSELITLKQKLMSSREKNISLSLRKEIGGHYECIFSSCARDDYSELLRKYYHSKRTLTLARKKKKNRKPVNTGPKRAVVQQVVPAEQEQHAETAPPPPRPAGDVGCNNKINNFTPGCLEKMQLLKTKLVAMKMSGIRYHTIDKNRLHDLIRKFHQAILSLHSKISVNSKTMKKVKILQQEAQTFLEKV